MKAPYVDVDGRICGENAFGETISPRFVRAPEGGRWAAGSGTATLPVWGVIQGGSGYARRLDH
jgi:hypothetical protein